MLGSRASRNRCNAPGAKVYHGSIRRQGRRHDMDAQEWVIIPGYKRHEVNKNGIVRSRKPGHPSVPWTCCTNGYPQVSIFDDGGERGRTVLVHKIVAMTFLRPIMRGEQIHHKDGRRHNPRLSNLEIIPFRDHKKQHRSKPYPSCIICGKEMLPGRKYCSEECRHGALYINRSCKLCGKTFEISKSSLAWRLKDPRYTNFGIYCSNKCKLSDPDSLIRLPKTPQINREEIIEIKTKIPFITQRELAKKFGMSRYNIGKILHGEGWYYTTNGKRKEAPGKNRRSRSSRI